MAGVVRNKIIEWQIQAAHWSLYTAGQIGASVGWDPPLLRSSRWSFRYFQRLLLFVSAYYRYSPFSSPDTNNPLFSLVFSTRRDRQNYHCAVQTPGIVVHLYCHAKLFLALAFDANPFGFYYVHIHFCLDWRLPLLLFSIISSSSFSLLISSNHFFGVSIIFSSYYPVKIRRQDLQTILSASFLDPSQAFLGLHCLLQHQPPYAEIGSRDHSTISSFFQSRECSRFLYLQVCSAYRVQARYAVASSRVLSVSRHQPTTVFFGGLQSLTVYQTFVETDPTSLQFYCYICLSPVIFSSSSCPIFCFSLIGS